MNNPSGNTERFDAYLHGEMRADERVQFERELDANAALKQEFDTHSEFISAVHDGAEYGEIRQQLRTIHNKRGVAGRSFFLTPQFLIPLASVAAIALLITIINPFVKEGTELAENGDYQNMSVEEAPAASESQAAVADSTFSEMGTAVDPLQLLTPYFLEKVEEKPAGTAFMISNYGYFLTSAHVVGDRQRITLQQKEEGMTFDAAVIHVDIPGDFAILKCHDELTKDFKPVPFRFYQDTLRSLQDIFVLGYPTNDLTYKEGIITAESGTRGDSLLLEASVPFLQGFDGSPLFTYDGDLAGILSKQYRSNHVTYFIDTHYILQIIETLAKDERLHIDMETNYTRRYKQHTNLVDSYRPYIFEVHH
jgi:serine protease Do